METAIKIEHLAKKFGKKEIIKDLSFETKCGEVFGFLGPNGAGKTTTIKMVVGLLHIDRGSISICGYDIEKDFEKALNCVGGIVENPEMYKFLTGRQNLMQYARMRKGVTPERIEEVIEIVGLKNRIDEKISKYSLGMRQRLGIAQSILHHPKVLILDEPTNGLDPAGIKNLRDILKKLAHEEGVCVLVSSHLMSEMELMCDRVGIIANGTLVDVKTIDELVGEANGDIATYTYHVDDVKRAMNVAMDAAKKLAEDNILPDKFTVYAKDENYFDLVLPLSMGDIIGQINKAIVMDGITLNTVSLKPSGKLEDVFIELTKNGGEQIA